MPRPDPLNNIMTQLREHGGGDPNQQAARQADLKQQRQQVGATPEGTMRPPQPAGGQGMPQDVMPQTPGSPDGISPDFQEQPNMMGVVVDALNEAIIGLKTEIHRSPEPESKRKLEKQAQKIRDAVLEMEGDPVWGDESIDEGLGKLRGLGAVGMGMQRPRDRAMQMRQVQMPDSDLPPRERVNQIRAQGRQEPRMEEAPQHRQPMEPQQGFGGPPDFTQLDFGGRPEFTQMQGSGIPDWVQSQRQRGPVQDPFGGWATRRRNIFDRMKQETGGER